MSLRATNVCVVDGDGNVVQEATLETDPDAIELFLAEPGIHLKRVHLEAFSYSARLFTALSEKGLAVICIESRHAKAALNAMLNKTDRNAKGIAQMRSKMLGMENMIRCLLRPFGLKVGEISVGRFDARVREIMAGKRELEAMVAPLFDARNAMRLQLAKLHRLPLAAARSDSAARRMITVPGVSAFVALTFRATVDDPAPFKKSTNVGAHFGLTPRLYQSGQTDRIGSISKCGYELTRSIL